MQVICNRAKSVAYSYFKLWINKVWPILKNVAVILSFTLQDISVECGQVLSVDVRLVN
jgi:hypothetical protein